MGKLNCWELKRCGRETGGSKSAELGVCPAATERKYAGIHGGQNAGRCCWIIANTLCDGKVQGTFATKVALCLGCDAYKKIKAEEGAQFLVSKAVFEKRP